MPVLKVTVPYGRACEPESDSSVTCNMPGWETARRLRDRELDMTQLTHLYPRLAPRRQAAELVGALCARILLLEEGKKEQEHEQEHEGKENEKKKGVLAWTHPGALRMARRLTSAPARGDGALTKDELGFRVVDVNGTRLFVVVYPVEKATAAMYAWMFPGRGVSIRLAESLLPHVSSSTIVEIPPPKNSSDDPLILVPDGACLPETTAHALLRTRISTLLRRSLPPQVNPDHAPAADDVFLYPSGMAAIYHLRAALAAYRPGGTAVLLGALFQHVWQISTDDDDRPGNIGGMGYKHFGRVDKEGIDVLEEWLFDEGAKRNISFVLVEFSSNPLLASVDLARLKHLTQKCGAVLVVDTTIASLANVDVETIADVTVMSLTKSFSGYANVLAGCVVLAPQSHRDIPKPHYAELKDIMTEGAVSTSDDYDSYCGHRNELFSEDAEVLLKNNENFLERSAILNRNARAMAEFLEEYRTTTITTNNNPVESVLYPSLLPDKHNYDAVMRLPSSSSSSLTDSSHLPGYGCLLTVNFTTVAAARAFYDKLGTGFFPGTHLGAHRSLAFCYNMVAWVRSPEETAYNRSYGLKEEGVRISAGLEDVQDLLDTLKEALDVAAAAVEEEGEKK